MDVERVDLRRPPTGVELVLEVDDVVAERDRVVAAGWPLLEGLQDRPWRLSDFRLLDDSGYYLRVTSRSLRPAADGRGRQLVLDWAVLTARPVHRRRPSAVPVSLCSSTPYNIRSLIGAVNIGIGERRRNACRCFLVKRSHDAWGILRRLIVEVVGQVVGETAAGPAIGSPGRAGRAHVQARMDWCTSVHVTLSTDERRTVEAALPLRALWDMAVRPGRALGLQRA